MGSIAQEMRFPVDLRGGLTEQPQRGKLMRGDKNAAVVIAELYDGEKPYEGNDVTVTGKFSRKGDGIDIQLDGTMENGAAMVTLDEHCFAVSGRYELRVKLTKDGIARTVLFISGYVENDGEGGILDVENVIPSIDDIVAQYAEMKRVTQETQEAADKANDAAEHAPYVDPTSRHWMEWDAEARKYVDTGIPATGPQGDDGYTPYIGENGNWFVGGNDTGVPAQGPPGQNGTGSGTVTGVKANGQIYEPDDSGVVDLGEQIGKQGPKGDPGPKPVKGTDYWTEDDKSEIVSDVLAALPNASGVDF